jgi:serine/threonine protein kinase
MSKLSVNVATLQHHLSIRSCIQCLGISKTHTEQDLKNETGCNLLPPDTYLLVMEYAEFGPLLTYFSKILQGNSFDWPRIRDILVDLTVCVFELHEVGIIHR